MYIYTPWIQTQRRVYRYVYVCVCVYIFMFAQYCEPCVLSWKRRAFQSECCVGIWSIVPHNHYNSISTL